MLTRRYQEEIAQNLRRIYQEVQVEWPVMTIDERTHFKARIYCPIIDIAVGPFATDQSLIEHYDVLMDYSQDFIRRLLDFHSQNSQAFDQTPSYAGLKQANPNSRCLIAIEVELINSIKYLMGSIVNATSVGRIGVVAVRKSETLRYALRAQTYLQYLKKLEKRVPEPLNLLILTEAQLRQAVDW